MAPGSAPPLRPAFPSRRQRKGGRLYFGCNICRLRKIKCDGRRPNCSNCERSRRYLCDGFMHNQAPIPSTSRESRVAVTRPTSISEGILQEQGDLGHEEAVNGASGSGPHRPVQWPRNRPEDEQAITTGSDGVVMQDDDDIFAGFPSFSSFLGLPNAKEIMMDAESWLRTEQGSTTLSVDAADDTTSSQPALLDMPDQICGHLESFGGAMGPSQVQPISPNQRPWHDSASSFPRPAPTPDQILPGIGYVPGIRPVTAFPPSELGPVGDVSSDTTRDLIHHYQIHVCGLMMPTSIPSRNPWLHLYLPMALRNPDPGPGKCLLYAILAVSAFNKAELGAPEKEKYVKLAMSFRDKASQLLGDYDSDAVLERRSEDPTSIQALLAAVLTLNTVEVFSGSKEGYGHKALGRAKHIIRRAGGRTWWLSNPTNFTLLQIFRCLEILSCTSFRPGGALRGSSEVSGEPPLPSDRPGSVAPRGGDGDGAATSLDDEADPGAHLTSLEITSLPFQYSLDVSFGISMKTLCCINSIAGLAQLRAQILSHKEQQDWTWRQVEDLVKLQSDIFDTLDDPNAFVCKDRTPGSDLMGSAMGLGTYPGLSGYVSEEIKQNHLWAFHYGTAIFFRRALCEGGREVVPRLPCARGSVPGTTTIEEPVVVPKSRGWCLSGQELVSKTLEHLENVDALSRDVPVANTLWPGFIAAVEARDMPLRHRAMIWFARAKRHGIGNIAMAKEVVMECWRRTDRYVCALDGTGDCELGPIDWREVMSEEGVDIMLT